MPSFVKPYSVRQINRADAPLTDADRRALGPIQTKIIESIREHALTDIVDPVFVEGWMRTIVPDVAALTPHEFDVECQYAIALVMAMATDASARVARLHGLTSHILSR